MTSSTLTIKDLTPAEKSAANEAAQEAIRRHREHEAHETCPDCGARVMRPGVGGWDMNTDSPRLETTPLLRGPRYDAEQKGKLWKVSGDGQYWPVEHQRSDDIAIYREHVCPETRANL